MRVAVIGANGRTGAHVVAQAVRRGQEIVAVARRPELVTTDHPLVSCVRADALDPDAVHAALADCDAVISTLGVGTSRAPTVLYSAGVANVLAAMRARAIERLVVVSAAPVGPPDEHPLVQRRLVLPILRRFFGATYEDMKRMEDALRASQADWVSLRPPRLVEKAGAAGYRIRVDSGLSGARSLRYVDLAAALLDVVSDRTLTRTAAYVAH